MRWGVAGNCRVFQHSNRMDVYMGNANLFSDDQVAIIGCLAAIAACMLMMGLSFRFGIVNQSLEESDVPGVTGEQTHRDSGRRAA